MRIIGNRGKEKRADCPYCGAIIGYYDYERTSETMMPIGLNLDIFGHELPKIYYLRCPRCDNKIFLERKQEE